MKKINVTKHISKELRELGFSTDGKKLGLMAALKGKRNKSWIQALLPKKILKIQKWRSKQETRSEERKNKEKVLG